MLLCWVYGQCRKDLRLLYSILSSVGMEALYTVYNVAMTFEGNNIGRLSLRLW